MSDFLQQVIDPILRIPSEQQDQQKRHQTKTNQQHNEQEEEQSKAERQAAKRENGRFLVFSYSRGPPVAEALLSHLGPASSVDLFANCALASCDPACPEQAGSEDARVRLHSKPWSDDQLISSTDEAHGAILDLGVPRLEACAGWPGLWADFSPERISGKWLAEVSEEDLAETLIAYGSLNDNILAKRFASAIAYRRRQTGPIESFEVFSSVVAQLKHDYEESHPHLDCGQLLRALRVPAVGEINQLRAALARAFEALAMGSKVSVLTYFPWEAQVLRDFLHLHEEPKSDLTKSIPADRRAELYPLLRSSTPFAVQQVAPPSWQLSPEARVGGSGSRSAMLHILEKIPRTTTPVTVAKAAAAAPTTATRENPSSTSSFSSVLTPPPSPPFGTHLSSANNNNDNSNDNSNSNSNNDDNNSNNNKKAPDIGSAPKSAPGAKPSPKMKKAERREGLLCPNWACFDFLFRASSTPSSASSATGRAGLEEAKEEEEKEEKEEKEEEKAREKEKEKAREKEKGNEKGKKAEEKRQQQQKKSGTPTSKVVEAGSEYLEEWTEEQCEAYEELKAKLSARKAALVAEGLSLQQQKKDPQTLAWNAEISALHRFGKKFAERAEQRCRRRVHVPVLLLESVDHLVTDPNGSYVDCTFGRGGHTRAILSILSEEAALKAFDVDPSAVSVGKALEEEDRRFTILHHPFGVLEQVIQEPLDGVLMDLGVSSPQLDDRSRGFSIKGKKDGPLDLRMNQEVGEPASKWLETIDSKHFAWVIASTCYRLDGPLPERLAEGVLERQRRDGPFTTTKQLVATIEEFAEELTDPPQKREILVHPFFVAIRVFLNREMQQLAAALQGIFQRLRLGGRCVIICFNRWEMAALRSFIREHELPTEESKSALPAAQLSTLYPALSNGKSYAVRQVVRPVRPTAEELKTNQRSKSLMYVLEKTSR